MGGKPCIRGLRVTVSMVLGLLASGKMPEFHKKPTVFLLLA